MQRMSRRAFLAGCAGAGAAASLPLWTANWGDVFLAAKDRPLQADTGILVLVTMYGGNDGLNTLVPYGYDSYHDARPEIAYGAGEVLKLDADYGFNPAMHGLHQMFDDGTLAVIRGVGYPEPDRSHFRSMDIWQAGSLDSSVETGWIGRWLDSVGADPLDALHLGPVLPGLATGKERSASSFSNQRIPQGEGELILALAASSPSDTPAMALVCESYRDSARAQEQLKEMYGDEGAPRIKLTETLRSQLDVVAACIAAEVPTRVYSVSIGGFDTHADEREAHQKLITKLDDGLTRFFKKISGGPHAKDVVVVAYSEFGRRVKANASDGTDHGTAGPVFVIGDRVKGGLHGDDPSLTDLVHDDLKVTTDFRDIYHEVLTRCLGSDSVPVVGSKRKDIGFLR